MLEPMGCLLAFGPQACALGPTHLIHRLIQMARDMETIQHVQSLTGLGRDDLQVGFHLSLHTNRSPLTTSGPSAFRPRRSVACDRRRPTHSKRKRRQDASIW